MSSTQYEVMAYRIAIPETGMGEGDVVPLPAGWIPLSAIRQGETALVLCYQQAAPPAGSTLTLTSLTPNSLAAGSSPATIDIAGAGFDDTCTVYADGTARATFYISATHLEYTARPDLATAGESNQIWIQNGPGDISNALTLTFT